MTEKSAMTEKKTVVNMEMHENQVQTPEPEIPAAEDEAVQQEAGNSAVNKEAAQPEIPAADDETMHIDPAEDALNASETIRDMALGLALCAAVLAVAGGIFLQAEWHRWVFGVLLGAAVAGLMLRHLYVTIDRALDMDADHATKYMKKSATLRILMAGAALAAGAFLPGIFHVFGVFAGILCLKFAAYLQPLTHKAVKFLSKGR